MLLDERGYVYEVQHLATCETRDAHVVCMRFYGDKQLKVTRRMTKVFQYLQYQAQYYIEMIGEVAEAGRGDEYMVRVYWRGLGDEKSTWEPLSKVLADAPALSHAQLKGRN